MIKKNKDFKYLKLINRNQINKINSTLNKTIIEYRQIIKIKKYLNFSHLKKLCKNELDKILDKTIINDEQIKKLKGFKYPNKVRRIYVDFKLFESKIKSQIYRNSQELKTFKLNKFLLKKTNLKNILNLTIFLKEKPLSKKYLKKGFKNANIKNKEYLNLKLLKKQVQDLFDKKIKLSKFLSKIKIKKSLKPNVLPEYVAALYYCDHFLFISKVWKSNENNLIVEKVIELPVPSQVIGDNVITNIDELIELSLDSFEVLNLSKPPILVILSSSLFNIKSFKKEDVDLIEEENEVIQSKSPYLPEDTFTDFQIFNGDIFNAIYTRKTLIKGWINTLKKINYPVIGITTPGPHQIDILKANKKIINELEFIIDIELSSSTIFTFSENHQISSQKLPYGSTLYRKKELVESYFSRLIKSIKLITNDLKVEFPEKIYVSGFGLDDFEYTSEKLPYPFVRFSELNKVNYKFPESSSSIDLSNKVFDSKLNTILGITNQCL